MGIRSVGVIGFLLVACGSGPTTTGPSVDENPDDSSNGETTEDTTEDTVPVDPGVDDGGEASGSVTCDVNNGGCAQNCEEVRDGVRCSCDDGYVADGARCNDIDECALDSCPQDCENTAGSFRCTCASGFDDVNGDGTECWSIPTLSLDPLSDSGVSDRDLTTNLSALVFRGTGEPGAELVVETTDGALELGRTTPRSDGTWTMPVDLGVSPGTVADFSLVARSISESGSTTPSAALAVAVDREPPSPPSNLTLAKSFTPRPTFRWDSEEPDARYAFALGSEPGPSADFSESRFFQPASDLAEGEQTLFVWSVDLAGNVSASVALSTEVITPLLLDGFDEGVDEELFQVMDTELTTASEGGLVKLISPSAQDVEVTEGNLSYTENTRGQLNVVRSKNPVSREGQSDLVVRAVIDDISAIDTGENPEVRSFFGAVSRDDQLAVPQQAIPFFEKDAALIFVQRDVSAEPEASDQISIAMVAKRKTGEVINFDTAPQRKVWTLQETPPFPLTIELRWGTSGEEASMRAQVFDAQGSKLIDESGNTLSFTLTGPLDHIWSSGAHVIFGSEIVSEEHRGETFFDSITVYRATEE